MSRARQQVSSSGLRRLAPCSLLLSALLLEQPARAQSASSAAANGTIAHDTTRISPVAAPRPVFAPAPKRASGGAALLLGGSAGAIVGVIGGSMLLVTPPGRVRDATSSHLMLSSLGLSLATSLTWQVWSEATLPAGTDRGYFNRVFIAGSSAGNPSTDKVVVTSAFHVLTAAALGLGVWRYLDFRSDARRLNQETPSELCNFDFAKPSAACSTWQTRTERLDRARRESVALLTGAAFLHVLGLATAEWWLNVQPSVSTHGGALHLRGSY